MVDDFDVEVRNKNLDRTCLVDDLSGWQMFWSELTLLNPHAAEILLQTLVLPSSALQSHLQPDQACPA